MEWSLLGLANEIFIEIETWLLISSKFQEFLMLKSIACLSDYNDAYCSSSL